MNIYNSPRYAHSLVIGNVGPGWQKHHMGIHWVFMPYAVTKFHNALLLKISK